MTFAALTKQLTGQIAEPAFWNVSRHLNLLAAITEGLPIMHPITGISCCAALLFSPLKEAQNEPRVSKDVLILQSTRDYKVALATAHQAAARLHTTLNLEGYRANGQTGLTMSKAECAESGFSFPAYVARGRESKNSAFVSIEFSNGYNGFAKGYYLVVAAVGEPGSSVIRQSFTAAKRWYPDAYAKKTQVWTGCIH